MLLSALALRPTPVCAAEYRAFGDITTVLNGQLVKNPYDVTSFLQAGGGLTYRDSNGILFLQADSVADIAGLRAHGFARIRGIFGSSLARQGNAGAIATYFDVVIDGPAGPVMTSFNMHLGGQRDAGSTNAPGASNNGGADVFVTFRVNGAVLTDTPGLVFSGSQLFSGSNASQPRITAEVGVLNGWRPPGGNITSPTFTVQTGTPFTLQIQIDVTGGAGGEGFNTTLEAFGNGDFGSTLRFVTDGPVFNLPSGYTASSVDAGITDNCASGNGCPATTTSTVPPGVDTTTTTMLPCATARCALDRALRDAACAGQTLPRRIARPLDQAVLLIDQAVTAPGSSAKALRSRAKRLAKSAAAATRKATRGTRPKLTAECGATIQGIVRLVRNGR